MSGASDADCAWVKPFHDIAKAKGWKTLTVDCGHDVMLDRSAELVAMLRDAAL